MEEWIKQIFNLDAKDVEIKDKATLLVTSTSGEKYKIIRTNSIVALYKGVILMHETLLPTNARGKWIVPLK